MKYVASLIAAGLVVAGSCIASFAQDATDSIKIGVHTSLSGKASFVGQGGIVGMQLAAAEINAHGGINGKKLNLVVSDDRGTPDGAVAAVRRLIEEDNVLAVFGAGISSSTVSVIPIFAQNDVPYYVSFASDPRVLDAKLPNVFLGSPLPARDYVKVFTTFLMKNLNAKNVALMLCDQAQCTSTGPLMKEALEAGGVKVFESNYNSGDTDYTGQVYEVKSANPDAIFIYGLPADGGRLIQQLRRAGVKAPIVGDAAMADPSVAKLAGAAAEGYYSFYIGGAQFVNDNSGEMGKFLASLKSNKIDLPQNTPNLYSTMAYADMYVLAEAIRAAGANVTREGLVKSLETNIHGFVSGKTPEWSYAEQIGLPRTFTPTDHQGNRTAQPVMYKDGKFVPAG